MKELILKILKSKLLFAVVINLLIMAFCILVTSFQYVTGRDYYNSILICQNHFYYGSTLNYILAVVVGTIQYAVTDINAFVLVEVGLSFCAFTSITFVFADKFNFRKAAVFTMVVNILFALNHYSRIESTTTAALLLAGGFLLVLNAIRNKRYNLPCWIGVAEIAAGSFYNYPYFFIALGFAVAYFFGDMIAKKKFRLDFQKIFWYFRPFLLMFLLITLIAVGLNQFSFSINHATQESTDYYRYSALTEEIDTLPFPDYSEHLEDFAAVGIDNDTEYDLLKNGYYDNDKMLNNDALQLVRNIQLQESEKTLSYVLTNTFTDMWNHIVSLDAFLIVGAVFLAISLVFILYHRNRYSFFPLFFAVASLVSGVCIRYLYTGMDYRIYGIWVLCIVMLLFAFNFEGERKSETAKKLRRKNGFFIISIIVTAALFGSYCAVYVLNTPSVEDDAPDSLITEINRNPDCYYVMDTMSRQDFDRYTENYLHPLWGFRSGYLENLDDFGYMHHYEMLRKRNLSYNIYEAVMTNHKIYVIDKNVTFKKEKYFNLNYTDQYTTAHYQLVKELDDYKIYEVVVERE